MQIITLTVIWDQSSSVTTFTTPRPPGCWQNKQITRCETGAQLLRHDNSSPWWPLAWSDHTRHSPLMWWPRKFIVVIKMGKLVAAGWGGDPVRPGLVRSDSCVRYPGSCLKQVWRSFTQSLALSASININWYWQRMLNYLIFKKRLCILAEMSHIFWRKYFCREQRKCCPEQNAKSKSVFEIRFPDVWWRAEGGLSPAKVTPRSLTHPGQRGSSTRTWREETKESRLYCRYQTRGFMLSQDTTSHCFLSNSLVFIRVN